MSRKNYYYVGIITDSSDLRFITSVDNASKTWRYDVAIPPLGMSKSVAESLAEALLMNFVPAVVVKSALLLTGHPGSKTAETGAGIATERLKEILISYIDNDLQVADYQYVRDVIRDTCGCTKEEINELGLDYLFECEECR